LKKISRILATFFGVGLFPVAPGTLASAVTVIGYKLVLHELAGPYFFLLLAGLIAAGIATSAVHAAELGRSDPGRIVIDEVCGQLLALVLTPDRWISLAIFFALFRFFDIIKPWPIRRLERLPGGWGIMADDLGAGLAAAVLGRVILHLI